MKVKHLLVIAVVVTALGVAAFFSSPITKMGVNLPQSESPRFLYDIAGDSPDRMLKEPTFALADSSGKVFVSDSGNRLVKVFDSDGRFLYQLGGPESNKQLVYPYGIGLLDHNRIVVADVGAGALYEFDSKGKYVKTWLEAKEKAQPAGVFVTRDKSVYVTDLAGNQVLVFSGKGELLQKIRSPKVTLKAPHGIAVNDDGTVWVADGGNYNIKLLKPD
ncbi:MAG: NHL repeat-containing protein, partial [Eubacteriales bacterium]